MDNDLDTSLRVLLENRHTRGNYNSWYLNLC